MHSDWDGGRVETDGQREMIPQRLQASRARRKGSSAPPKVLNYGSEGTAGAFDPEKLRDLHAPVALIAVGMVIGLLSAWLDGASLRAAATSLGTGIVISAGIMLPAFFLAAKLKGFEFGRLPNAILKLMAIAVAPGALMQLAGLLLGWLPLSWILIWVAGLVFYFALIGYFFELDQEDTWFCVIAIFLAQLAVRWFM